MILKLLGGPTGGDGSPRLWKTDRGSFVVQGWRTNAQDVIEIPHQLLGYAELDTCLSVELHDTGRGTFTLSGRPVIDPNALTTMNLPDYETAVEVQIAEANYPHALSRQLS
jgi:hypothetical protein